MPSQHLCPQYLLQSILSWGSFSYFDPEHKANFVLKIKGGGGEEGRGGRVRGTRFYFMTCSATVCMCVMYIMTKINFCYHATVVVIRFSIEWQIGNSSSWTCRNIAQCMIGIRLRFFILVLSISGPVFFSYNSTILQFLYNFSLAVANSVLFYFVFCFFFTLFSSD